MFFELLEQAQLLAINAAIAPSAESVYRIKCRQYSVQFHTPLHLVYELDPMAVLQALCEDQYPPSIVEEELEEIIERLYKIQDPSYSRMSQQETEDLVDAVINKESKRLGKSKEKTSEKTLLRKNTSEKEVKPLPQKSGGMSFESLERSEELSEGNKGGFKE